MPTSGQTALLVGASGLVGSELLQLLLQDPHFGEVVALVRKPLSVSHPKLKVVVFDFEAPDATCIRADVLFCCLGTTMRKAGSKPAFRKVDYDYPLQIAAFGKANGAQAFHLVTAMGADTGSLFFYNRVKGELEDALTRLDYNSLHLYRPSLLLGDRKEQRTGEKIGEYLLKVSDPLLRGGLKKYRAIQARSVAKAMLFQAKRGVSGRFVHESDQLEVHARLYDS